jgi:tetratricopeptide (TPR) repeat protein
MLVSTRPSWSDQEQLIATRKIQVTSTTAGRWWDILNRVSDGAQNSVGNEVHGTVDGSLVQAHTVHGDVYVKGSRRQSSAPRQLPGVRRDLVGRRAELKTLTAMLDRIDRAGVPDVALISGMGGIGKTALVLTWAHSVCDRFPDGQIYLDLGGFGPAQTPTTLESTLASMLTALGEEPELIPSDLTARLGMYRTRTADRRLLLVLDNVWSTDQVRLLIPGSAGSTVVITSRHQLSGLVTGDIPLVMSLRGLGDDDAERFLALHLGDDRVAREAEAVSDIVAACAGLPLALSIVTARAIEEPHWPLARFSEELQYAAGGLDGFHDPEECLRTVFSWSYKHLSDEAVGVFCVLAHHPAPSISEKAAASMVGVSLQSVRRTLQELRSAHMITRDDPDRVAFHDLLRAFAHDMTASGERRAELDAAIPRLLDYYRLTACNAAEVSYPHLPPITLGPAEPDVVPETFTDHGTALRWLSEERAGLLAAVRLAVDTGRGTNVWQLCWAIEEYLARRWYRDDHQATMEIALAATSPDDILGLAHVRKGLGRADQLSGRYDAALGHLGEALSLFEKLDDGAAQADVCAEIGRLWQFQRQFKLALVFADRSLVFAIQSGNRHREARALNDIGWYYIQLGRYSTALDYCQRALVLHREIGDRYGEGQTLHSLGCAHLALQDPREAAHHFQQGLDLLDDEIRDRYYEAVTYVHLGDAYHADRKPEGAREVWERALNILSELGGVPVGGFDDINADRLLTKLAQLDEQEA